MCMHNSSDKETGRSGNKRGKWGAPFLFLAAIQTLPSMQTCSDRYDHVQGGKEAEQ